MSEIIHAVPVLSNQNYFTFKRVIDIVFSAIVLIVLAPLLLLIAILIRLDSRGNPIFSQERIGAKYHFVDGRLIWEIRPFTVYKFRSMYVNGDAGRHRTFVQSFIRKDYAAMDDIQGEDITETGVYKMKSDPRITRIGKILRKTSLDEFPQFWNVLMGDMTLVGPRPALAYEVEIYEPWHRRRLEAVPGITGLWQVSGRSTVDFDKMVQLDIDYIENQSLWSDLKILCQTPAAVIFGKGAS